MLVEIMLMGIVRGGSRGGEGKMPIRESPIALLQSFLVLKNHQLMEWLILYRFLCQTWRSPTGQL